MTQEQVEHVVRAFYEAEFPDPWDNAQRAIREHFRYLVRTAVATQPSDCPMSPVSYQGKCRVLERKIA